MAGGNPPAQELLEEAYGEDSRQVMDVILPAGRSRAQTPVLLYIHGGSWVGGSKEEFYDFLEKFQSELPDFAFVTINYRLFDPSTTQNAFPTQEEDVKAAIAYVVANRENWEVSDRLFLTGASAGGHLALLHAYKHPEIGSIQGVAALFPPTDFVSLFTYNSITGSLLQAIFKGSPQSRPEAYQEASPLTFVSSSSVPSIFFHGTLDQVVPIAQSELLATKLLQSGVRYDFRVIDNQGHGFTEETYHSVLESIAAFFSSTP